LSFTPIDDESSGNSTNNCTSYNSANHTGDRSARNRCNYTANCRTYNRTGTDFSTEIIATFLATTLFFLVGTLACGIVIMGTGLILFWCYSLGYRSEVSNNFFQMLNSLMREVRKNLYHNFVHIIIVPKSAVFDKLFSVVLVIKSCH